MLLATALLGVLIGTAARRFQRIDITGESMVPALEPGDRALVLRAGRLRRGDIVACTDPQNPNRTVVKRVAALPGEHLRLDGGASLAAAHGYVVLGDNSDASTDSRHFGPIDPDLIIGRLIFRYLPEHRAGAIPRRSARFV